LAHIEWLERGASSEEAGVAWLELLIDFEEHSGMVVRTTEGLQRDGARLLRREPDVAQLVYLLRREIINAVHSYFSRDVARLFAPCRGGRARFAGSCVRGSGNCLQAWPLWALERHDKVLVAVLGQRGVPLGLD
ncbi:MAG: hypothetical protein ACKPKO_26645, partial [Candidatus Fonsibacter sp.]